ncbi:beta-ketoacyl synthase N-terminal-like domain-containing protein [Priestia megaterium]|uniref:beta-ketoacyl synthase N-terminal-like domain-containing protein n=1 Tax=Priestia megaterium TaxID=1404 RepID=UPI001656AD9F|nr:beta-ketoacyl synthase N-terminal-like domain-containing protein [Priestia megaterium]
MEEKIKQMKNILLSKAEKTKNTASSDLREKVQTILIQTIAELLRKNIEDIDTDDNLINYGFDQFLLTALANKLNQQYQLDLTFNILSEYRTIRQITDHLVAIQGISQSKANRDILKDKTLYQLKVLFCETISLRIDQMDVDESLERYGIDSLIISKLNQRLTVIFGELSKTLFFEYQTLNALASFFVVQYPQACIKWTEYEASFLPKNLVQVKHGPPVDKPLKAIKEAPVVPNTNINSREPIAIIGVSGRYPQANNLKEYWENLESGKNCISEIPGNRWSMESFFHPDKPEAIAQGKSYCKWGGFIERFAEFDPLFFNISPREAINIDPQERLLLEESWKALEDAGYTKERLAKQHSSRVGVFVGATKTGFELYGPDLWKQGENIFPRTSFASMANRVSYFLNLKGPSIPVDTMCSSSLSAVHEACEHLYRDECEMAIAGGVNLYLHPSNYVFLCAHRMLSTDSKCKSFGIGSDGFIPGEGVGVILLKRLSQAITDGDQIYAVIRGTNINHGGKTNGYTVPNPNAQGELIQETLNKAGVNARAISYIEAHGTGTELGDPIEITGLTKAFHENTKDTEFCSIGSVKSNIGHLEAAAGIAAITKVVLQIKNQKLVPSLHAKETNPNINFRKTPFVIQQELTEWKRPIIEINGENKECPRTAGISSFGAGGANAHVIIEEYIPEEENKVLININSQNPAVIVLSAKNEEQLRQQAQQLLKMIQEQQVTNVDLPNMAYTLQVGREEMEERLAMTVESIRELEQKLKDYIYDKDGITSLYRGQFKRNQETLTIFAADEDMTYTIEAWILKRKYDKLLALWVKGLVVDWDKLYGENRPRRISMPTYPFVKQHIWLPAIKNENQLKIRLEQNNHKEIVAKKVVSDLKSLSNQKVPATSQQVLSTNSKERNIQSDQVAQSILSEPIIEMEDLNKSNKPRGLKLKSLSDQQITLSNQRIATRKPIVLSLINQHASCNKIEGANPSHTAFSEESLQEELKTTLAEALFMNQSDVDIDMKFIDMGLDSVVGVEWIRVINEQYGTSIVATKIYDYPTIRDLAKYLKKELIKTSSQNSSSSLMSDMLQETSYPISTSAVNSRKMQAIEPKTAHIEHEVQHSTENNSFSLDVLQEELKTTLAGALLMNQSDVDIDMKFIDMGLDSVVGVEWIRVINEQYGTSIVATKIYDYPTIHDLAKYLKKELIKTSSQNSSSSLMSDMLQETSYPISTSAVNSRKMQAIEPKTAHIEHEVQHSTENNSFSLDVLQEELKTTLAGALLMNQSDVDIDMKFIDMGLDSVVGVEWIRVINEQYGTSIVATKIYDYPTIREFAGYLKKTLNKQVNLSISMDEVLNQVYQGTLEIEQANQILYRTQIKEELK